MITLRTLTLASVGIALLAAASTDAQAGGPYTHRDRIARRYAAQRPWHGNYAHTNWGTPLALVVPPTADTISSYGWGVTATEVRPIYHQFDRYYPGEMDATGGQYLPTPLWPSHTDQFGVYPIRGPW